MPIVEAIAASAAAPIVSNLLFGNQGGAAPAQSRESKEQKELRKKMIGITSDQIGQAGPQADFNFTDMGPSYWDALQQYGVSRGPGGTTSFNPNTGAAMDYFNKSIAPDMLQNQTDTWNRLMGNRAAKGGYFSSVTGRAQGRATADFARDFSKAKSDVLFPEIQKGRQMYLGHAENQAARRLEEDKWRWGSGQMVGDSFDPTSSPYWTASQNLLGQTMTSPGMTDPTTGLIQPLAQTAATHYMDQFLNRKPTTSPADPYTYAERNE